MAEPIRVFIVDGYAALNHLLKIQIELEPGLIVVGEAEARFIEMGTLIFLEPDVILIDVDSQFERIMDTAQSLRAALGSIPILFLSLDDRPALQIVADSVGRAQIVVKEGNPASLMKALRRAGNENSIPIAQDNGSEIA